MARIATLLLILLPAAVWADPEWELTQTGEGDHMRRLYNTKITALVNDSSPCAPGDEHCDHSASFYQDAKRLCVKGNTNEAWYPDNCQVVHDKQYHHFRVPVGDFDMLDDARVAIENDWKVILHIDSNDIEVKKNGGVNCTIRRLVVVEGH